MSASAARRTRQLLGVPPSYGLVAAGAGEGFPSRLTVTFETWPVCLVRVRWAARCARCTAAGAVGQRVAPTPTAGVRSSVYVDAGRNASAPPLVSTLRFR